MTFLNLPVPQPGTRLILGGDGEGARAIRRASWRLDAYVPRWDRDFRDLGLADAGPGLEGASILLGPAPFPEGVPTIHLGATLPPGGRPGTLWYLGARRYQKEERDLARSQQRLLPLAEIGLDAGLRTALLEIGPRPGHLVLDLDVLDPAWAPAVARPCGLGAQPLELWRAFEVLRDGPLRSFEVRGLVVELDHDGRTAFLAAEAVRDLALLLWGGRPQGESCNGRTGPSGGG